MKAVTSICLTFLILMTVISCTAPSDTQQNVSYIKFNDESDISLNVGDVAEFRYIFVSVNDVSDFSPHSINFVSENTDIATVSFEECLLGSYLYFSVAALDVGDTYIYAVDERSGVRSARIKVSVVTTSVSITDTNDPASDPSETDPDDSAHESSEPKPNSDNIKLISITSPISRNQTATVSIKGLPNTEYSIEVFYSTSASSAAGLETKLSDDAGVVEWSWKIGGKTASGTHRIVITGSGESSTFYFTIE